MIVVDGRRKFLLYIPAIAGLRFLGGSWYDCCFYSVEKHYVSFLSGAGMKRSAQPASFLSSRSKSLPIDGLPLGLVFAMRAQSVLAGRWYVCARVCISVRMRNQLMLIWNAS